MNKMGFIIVRQRGSHVFMQRGDSTVTVTLNNPIKKSTLKSILNQAGVSIDELIEHLLILFVRLRFEHDLKQTDRMSC